MTIRAVVLGLLGAAAICGVTYFNDAVIRQTQFTGNNFPFSVYGTLILLLLVVNPLLALLGKRFPGRRCAFTGGELAVMLTLTLAACCIPGSALMRSFTSTVMIPHHAARTDPGWQEEGIVKMAPERILATVEGDEQRALNGFVMGLSEGDRHISLGEIPWSAWTRTLGFWMPLILVFWIGLIGLSLVIHRQWAHHEQLRYPIAEFVGALFPEGGRAIGAVFRNRLFWGGLATVLVVHLVNYTHAWWNIMVRIPTTFDFSSLLPLFPTFARGAGAGHLAHPLIYFTVMAFAYFLATEVSLSLGIAPFLYTYGVGILVGYGVSVGGGYYSINPRNTLQAGAYVGTLVMILYTGRHYYLDVLRRAVRPSLPGGDDTHAVWGARVFLLCAGLFTVDLILVGLDWPLAVMYTVLIVGIFVVLSRIIAETGLFHFNPFWSPGILIVGLLGAKAVGPSAALIIFLLSTVLLIEPRGSLMPFMVNSFKLLDERKVRIGRTAALSVVALVLGLAIAVPVTLYFQYDRGVNLPDQWANRWIPRLSFRQALRIKQRLKAQDALEKAESVSGWKRFSRVSPSRTAVIFFGAGLAFVLLFSAGRLRLPWWPLHPVLFLVWTTGHARGLAASFLLGWLVKVLVTKYGGMSVYRRLKPLMFGLIAGDMVGGVIVSVVGAIYYFMTGHIPVNFSIMGG